MNSTITELYQVAKDFAANPAECSATQFEDALSVIELVEDGESDEALAIGLVY